MSALHRVVAALDHRTRNLHITTIALAASLDVPYTTVRHWRMGTTMPAYESACAWAALVGLHIAVLDGRHVVAIGIAVLDDLGTLRKRRGLTQRALADLRGMRRAEISVLERSVARGRRLSLSTLDRHVTSLDYRLTALWSRQEARAA